MPVNCKQYLSSLEVEASPFSGADRDAHAAACPRCRAAAQDQEALREALRCWTDEEAPAGLAERALALCEAEPAGRTGRRFHPRWTWLAAGPALAACAAAGLWLAARGPVNSPPPTRRLTDDQRYALAALVRAGEQVSRADKRSWTALTRAAQLLEERGKR